MLYTIGMSELDHIDQEWIDSIQGCLVDLIEEHQEDCEAWEAMIHGREDDRIFAEMDDGSAKGK